MFGFVAIVSLAALTFYLMVRAVLGRKHSRIAIAGVALVIFNGTGLAALAALDQTDCIAGTHFGGCKTTPETLGEALYSAGIGWSLLMIPVNCATLLGLVLAIFRLKGSRTEATE